jgi:hypothetical protein
MLGDNEVGTITFSAVGTSQSLDIPTEYQGTDKAYKIVSNKTGNQVSFSKLSISYEKAAPLGSVKFTDSEGQVYVNGDQIIASENDKITISADNATKLVINDKEYGNNYTYTVTESIDLTVVPYKNNDKGTESTVSIMLRSADALDEPTFTDVNGENIPSGEYNAGTTIYISSKENLAYEVTTGEGDDAKTLSSDIITKGENGSIYEFKLTTDYIQYNTTNGITIDAYSIDDSDNESFHITRTYSIIQPNAPQFVTESGAIANGSDVIISAGEDAAKIGYQINDGKEQFATLDENHQASISVSKDAADSEGNVRITALAYNEAGAWSKENVTATFIPTDADTYKIVSDATELKIGSKVLIVYDTKVMTTDLTGDQRMYGKDYTVEGTGAERTIGILPTDPDALVFELEVAGESTDTYVPVNFLTTNLSTTQQYFDISTAKQINWTDDATTSYVAIDSNTQNATIAGATTLSPWLQWNSSNAMFRPYANSTGSKVQLYRLEVPTVPDNSTIELEGATIAKTTLNEKVALTEDEGWTEKYPAYYTEANQLLFKYNINSDTDENATYTVEVTAGDETIKVTDAKAGENTVAVPLDGPYSLKLAKITFSDGSEQELNSVLDDLNLNIDFEPADAEFNDKIISGSNFILDWELKNISETLVSYVTYQFANDADEIGVATEDYTALGLKGYTRYDGETFVEANNWARIAAQNGHLPVHFANLQAESDGNYVIIGEIKVVYPFYYNNTLDCKSKELVTTIDIEEYIYKEDIPTSINSVKVDANGEAEYYNLQGVRVYSPANGLYIRKQGNTVSKVRL